MFCKPLKPFNKCFRAATTKKHHFSRENGQKKCQFWAQIRVFWIWVVNSCPCYPILRVLNSKKICFMPLQPLHTCFRGATTKKNIFRRKMAKKCQFLAQIRVFWVRLVSWSPPYPILRVLDSEKDVLHAIEAIEQVFQGRHHQKNTIFRPKMAKKMPFF